MELSNIRLEKESFDELKSILCLYLGEDCNITFSDQSNTRLTYHFLDSEGEESSCPEFYNYNYLLRNNIDYFNMFHQIISLIYYNDRIIKLMEMCKDQLMQDEDFKTKLINFMDKEINSLIKFKIKSEIKNHIGPNSNILSIYIKAIDELKKEYLLE